MRSPVRWFGGKGNLVAKLLKFVPSHSIYVEVFGGGASLLFAKDPSPVEVYNDIDQGLVNFFAILRNPETFAELHRRIALTPCSRTIYDTFRKDWDVKEDPIERAFRWFVVARQSFSGNFASGWSSTIRDHWRGVSGSVATYLSAVDKLPEAHMRLMTVQIENLDFRQILARYDTKETFAYCDGPYIHATRKNKRYAHEMTDRDHQDLIDILLGFQGKVMLSGYRHPLYDPLAAWTQVILSTSNFAVARSRGTGVQGEGSATEKHATEEMLYMNY